MKREKGLKGMGLGGVIYPSNSRDIQLRCAFRIDLVTIVSYEEAQLYHT